MNANRVRYRWSIYDYQRRVAAEYERAGVRPKRRWESYAHYFDDTFYDYLTYWKDTTPTPPDQPEWETPGRKKRAPKRKPKAQSTRKMMLRQRIDEWNDKINKAIQKQDLVEKRRLEAERNKFQIQYDRIRD